MGSNLVIVAIPDENDRVWKVSSEKIPHLTLLFLGEADKVQNLDQIMQFVEHASSTMLNRFYLSVDRRDKLGADDADVLFFRKAGYDVKAVREFRNALLKDTNIKTAYDSATQFEGWTPHLTLGYPATPAEPIPDNEIDRFYDVQFNKIAVWMGDFEGPEFLLKDYWDEMDLLAEPSLAMSSMNQERVKAGLAALDHSGVKDMKWGVRKTEAVSVAEPLVTEEDTVVPTAIHGEAFVEGLMHFGIKGMKWGVRKPPPSPVATSATSKVPHGDKRKTKIEAAGGQNHPAHEDAIKVAEARIKLKKSGPAALSNQELREVAQRLQLEGQVAVLTSHKGKRFVTQQLQNEGQNLARQGVKKGAKKAAIKVGAAALI